MEDDEKFNLVEQGYDCSIIQTDTDTKTKKIKSYILVEALCCVGEADLVRKVLGDIEGVDDNIIVSLLDRTVIVTHSDHVDPLDMIKALNSNYLGASLKDVGRIKSSTKKEIGSSKRKLHFGGDSFEDLCFFVQVVFFVTGVILQYTDPECEFPCPIETWGNVNEMSTNQKYALLLYFGVIALSRKMFRLAWSAMMTCRANAEFLLSIAVIGSLFEGDVMSASLAALIVTGMYDFKTFIFSRVKKLLEVTINSMDRQVTLIKGNGTSDAGQKISANDLMVGMKFIVRAGEMIPCDGIVVKGYGEVDESRITGEVNFVNKEEKYKVSSGSILQSGYLVVEVEKIMSESFGSEISNAVSNIQGTKSPTQEMIDKFAAWYTPCIILIAIVIAIYQRNLHKFLLIIIAGCPCALVGCSPMVYGASVAVLSKKHNLLIKSADALCSLAAVTSIGFDKTGTVTKGEFKLIDMKCFESKKSNNSSWTFDDVHRWASTVESADNHPLAHSITKSYTGCVSEIAGGDILPPLDDFKRHGRCGVSGVVEERFIGVGNEDFLNLLKIPLEGPAKQLFKDMQEKGLIVFVTVDYELAAIMLLSDSIKDNSAQTIQELKNLNIKSSLITGDKGFGVSYVTAHIPFTQVCEGLLPQQKADWVQDEKQSGEIVGFVGDGLNDCVALASSDIGISVQEVGFQATIDAASAVLQADIGSLPSAIIIAQRAKILIAVNIFIVLFLNALVIIIVANNDLPIYVCELADSLTLLFILANSLWPLTWNLSPVNGQCNDHHDHHRERFKPLTVDLL